MSSTLWFLNAPMRGVVVPLSEVPDPVFGEGVMGPGIAIDPLGETLHAPCNGEVIQCARTAHAITLRDDGNHEWLLHIGLDTVDLGGEGFELLVSAGEHVSAGDPLCRFDADRLAQRATALVSPIVLTNGAEIQLETLVTPGTVVEMWRSASPLAGSRRGSKRRSRRLRTRGNRAWRGSGRFGQRVACSSGGAAASHRPGACGRTDADAGWRWQRRRTP